MIKKKKELIVFLFIFIIAYFQNKYIGFYHDDYGYAALSYGVKGSYQEFSLYNAVLFVKDHYLHWGGRVLFFFFEILALQLDMQGFMLIQSIVVSIIIFFTYKTIISIVNCDNISNKIFILFIFIGMYLLFAKNSYQNALFWASASVLYVWPLCPMMIGIYLFYRWCFYKDMSLFRLIVMGTMFFIAAFSQEQISLTVLSTPILFFIYTRNFLNYNEIKKPLIIIQISSLLGSACLLLAPGNFRRLDSGHDGGLHSLTDFPAVTWDFLQNLWAAPGSILWISAIIFCLFMGRKKNVKPFFPFLFMAFVSLSIFYIIKLKYLSPRIYFPASFFLTIFSCAIFSIIIFKNRCLNKYMVHIASIFLVCAISHHAFFVLRGYYINYPIIIKNDLNLKNASKEKSNEVIFYKLPMRWYHECMPYDDRAYIEKWIKQYYKIDMNTKIIYKDYNKNLE